MTKERIFLSYRRADTPYVARSLFDRLQNRFGAGSVFMDVESVPLGQDFEQAIQDEINSCDVLLALIGPGWLDAILRRADLRDDYVRREITAALKAGKSVLPVLVDEAEPPPLGDLPEELAAIATLQGLRLSHEKFERDVAELVSWVASALTAASNDATSPEMDGIPTGHDYRSEDLTGRDLRNEDLRGSVLRGMTLQDVTFAGADLTGADFTGSRMVGGSLRGATTAGSRWTRTLLLGVDGVKEPEGRRELDVAAVSGRDQAGPMKPATGPAFGVAFAPDGSLLAVARSGGVELFDVRVDRTLGMPGELQRDVRSVVFSPTGSMLASTREDGAVGVWDLSAGTSTTLWGPDATVWGAAFSPDGSLLVLQG